MAEVEPTHTHTHTQGGPTPPSSNKQQRTIAHACESHRRDAVVPLQRIGEVLQTGVRESVAVCTQRYHQQEGRKATPIGNTAAVGQPPKCTKMKGGRVRENYEWTEGGRERVSE